MNNQEEIKIIKVKDFLKIILLHRKKIILSTIIGALIGIIIAVSLPTEYSSTVKLIPVIEGSVSNNQELSNLLGNLDIKDLREGNDAIDIFMYPDIVKTIPFITSLFSVEVKEKSFPSKTTTLENYIVQDIKKPWWIELRNKIFGIFNNFIKNKESEIKSTKGSEQIKTIDSFHLSERDNGIVSAIGGRIEVEVKENSNLFTINVKMQDPLVAAIVADTVRSHLEKFILNYKRLKIENDLHQIEVLRDSSKEAYHHSQLKAANYIDTHHAIWSNVNKIELDSLQFLVSQNYQNYINLNNQYNITYKRLKSINDVFFVLEPSRVENYQISPIRSKIILNYSIIGFLISAIWYVSIKPVLKKRLGIQKLSLKSIWYILWHN